MSQPSVSAKLIEELQEFSLVIRQTKEDIALSQNDIGSLFQFNSAHDELDAVVICTAQATHIILDAAEHIESLGVHLGTEHAQQLNQYITRLYESCTFQDITGQRISKVVKLLRFIETELERILSASEMQLPLNKKESLRLNEADALVHGPQLPHTAFQQDDIDALFNDTK
jgi:chemotaxis protein CheZ